MISYKYFIILMLCTFTFSENIIPVGGIVGELLEIKGKSREYFSGKDSDLQFAVNGPRYYRLISRCAVPQSLTNTLDYNFSFTIDESYKYTTHHSKKLNKRIKSSQHPGYGYTNAGNDVIYIPKGEHTLFLQSEDSKNPILYRLLVNSLHNREDNTETVSGLTRQVVHHLKVGNNSLPYTLVNSGNDFEIEIEGPSYIDIINRLVFDKISFEDETYSLAVKKNGKDYRTYHFLTKASEKSSIIEDSLIIPGKWRTLQIKVPAGKQHYSISIPNSKQSVYIRCLLH